MLIAKEHTTLPTVLCMYQEMLCTSCSRLSPVCCSECEHTDLHAATNWTIHFVLQSTH